MTEKAPCIAERIQACLRDDILRGRYRAGDRLPSERELAERFGTHRGAVREAFGKLEQLGLAEIRPGGARAAPIQDASLDVVRYLMELEQPPDPELFDQIFEVFGGLFAHAARLAAERADDEQRARVAEVLDRLAAEELPVTEEHELIHELSRLFVEASQNLIFVLVRNGLQTQFLERIENHEALLRPPDAERAPLARALARAMAERDGPAAADAVSDMARAVRRHAVELLRAAREHAPAPKRAGVLPR